MVNRKDGLQWLININRVWMLVSNVPKSANRAAISVSARCRNVRGCVSIAQTSVGIARPSSVVTPASSQSFAACVPPFVTPARPNAKNIKTSIAGDVLRRVGAVRKNAGKWPPARGHDNSQPEFENKAMQNRGRGSSSLAPLGKTSRR